jgi:hypothetical protein
VRSLSLPRCGELRGYAARVSSFKKLIKTFPDHLVPFQLTDCDNVGKFVGQNVELVASPQTSNIRYYTSKNVDNKAATLRTLLIRKYTCEDYALLTLWHFLACDK